MDNIILFKHSKGEGVFSMCKVLDKIRGKTANQLLEEYNAKSTLPIDLKKLLLSIGISALPRDFKNLEKSLKSGEILGLLLANGDNAAILYREKDSLNRQRFTIAHELAHCCLHLNKIPPNYLHIEYRTDKEAKSEHEKAADIFAGELLIPLDKLTEIYLSLDVPTSTKLAYIFGVSTHVMEARLDYLQVSYYNTKGEAIKYGA